ncbi:MAG TPA: hypothetical protein DDZ81_20590 [Acetobacteraceae bacterium]|nr:hypothetical protein [Acetobacteraceae bacterium]
MGPRDPRPFRLRRLADARRLALCQHNRGRPDRPAPGRLGVNNGEAVLPAAIAGLGIAALPDFIARHAVTDDPLEPVLANSIQPPP